MVDGPKHAARFPLGKLLLDKNADAGILKLDQIYEYYFAMCGFTENLLKVGCFFLNSYTCRMFLESVMSQVLVLLRL